MKSIKYPGTFACALVVLLCTQMSFALELPNVFASKMVLQRDKPVQVWGTAKAGSSVQISFAGQTAKATADEQGHWQAALSAMKANATPQSLTVTGDDKTITLEDVLVGEVWICSGQSNMAWVVKNVNNAEQEIASAKYPTIRLCRVANTIAAEPRTDTKISWNECTPETIPGFSAVGYFFGRNLQENLNVPIGLIHTNWGGTPAEAWTSTPTLEKTKGLDQLIPNAKKGEEKYPQQLEAYKKNLEEYNTKLAKWKEENPGKPANQFKVRKPRTPSAPGKNPRFPSVLFNGMIHPLIPFTVRGAIWYQGEANAGRPDEYRLLLATMIQDWRDLWKQDEFAFGIVQLANYHDQKNEPANSGWTNLQDAQLYVSQTVPLTGLAVINDIGEAKNIHPRNKQDVGKRLALWALHDVYKTISSNWTGPVFDSAQINGNKIAITFKHVDGKLNTHDGKAPAEFTICGEDQNWVNAQAKITGNSTVEVWADGVDKPFAARYAWQDNPINPNLTDGSKLQVSCFSTVYIPLKK
jgi:sialate O-acetylesterase